MGRKPKKINPECGKRLSEWLSDIGITQSELSKSIGYTQQYISDVITGKKALSLEMAQIVSEKVLRPFTNINGEIIGHETVRPQWLLCLDENKTEYDHADALTDRREYVFKSEWAVLDESARKQGYKILLNHPGIQPTYLSMLAHKEKCNFSLQEGETVIDSFSVVEFIKLTIKLEKYADFLIWELFNSKTEG